mmetsp:Transcript_17906/g.41818  ORF Transcript_17906/g.41818 Transcript_17906/m.41818 type:complete len:214 (+) Transcript_17906:119-760(+)
MLLPVSLSILCCSWCSVPLIVGLRPCSVARAGHLFSLHMITYCFMSVSESSSSSDPSLRSRLRPSCVASSRLASAARAPSTMSLARVLSLKGSLSPDQNSWPSGRTVPRLFVSGSNSMRRSSFCITFWIPWSRRNANSDCVSARLDLESFVTMEAPSWLVRLSEAVTGALPNQVRRAAYTGRTSYFLISSKKRYPGAFSTRSLITALCSSVLT